MSFLIPFIIAVSLSMDAFSLALAYGTQNISKPKTIILSISVGIFHFFMPLFGYIVGYKIINILPIKPNTLIFIVLFIIGIQMILESIKNNNIVKPLSYIEILLFSLAVSLDSFTIGLGLEFIYKNIFISVLLFSITSLFFTYVGLNIGKIINQIIGKLATFIGGLILIIVGILYIL